MFAKRLFFVSGAMAMIMVAFAMGATVTRGQSSAFRVIGPGVVVVGDTVYHLDVSNAPFGWKPLPDASFTLPPVPGSSLVDWESGILAVTDTGEGWGKVGGVWTDLGTIPGTPVQRTTWGQVKAKYRER